MSRRPAQPTWCWNARQRRMAWRPVFLCRRQFPAARRPSCCHPTGGFMMTCTIRWWTGWRCDARRWKRLHSAVFSQVLRAWRRHIAERRGLIASLLQVVPPDFGLRVGVASHRLAAWVSAAASRPGRAAKAPPVAAASLDSNFIELLPLSQRSRDRLHRGGRPHSPTTGGDAPRHRADPLGRGGSPRLGIWPKPWFQNRCRNPLRAA